MAEIILEESIWGRELKSTFDDVKDSFGDVDKLAPALSKKNVDFHMNILTKGYYTKYAETESAFAFCGAKLHEIWWEQFNGEKGDVSEVVKKLGHHESVEEFTNELLELADTLQGNGWIVVTNNVITTCSNHSWSDFDAIILLIDLWEHAYQVDYGSDKKVYIEKAIDVISWDVIQSRL